MCDYIGTYIGMSAWECEHAPDWPVVFSPEWLAEQESEIEVWEPGQLGETNDRTA